MWLFVMFDLPVTSKRERKRASKFRNQLLDFGFEMSQFSVYLKYCASAEKAEAFLNRVRKKIPTGGKVDILTITDRQFSNIVRVEAGERMKIKDVPAQLQIF